ncbi:MAG: WecB/TagA/CpsF family glycosyltransferase [Proteobacteria bacterium]|nr:WecB/TagA/CpsF family glycosyltransferase [Pseudomonadota bacterium]MBU1710086.1 WecB/TagA/CpsF family glycosyltransferase [Pseudomonadota bacterium]
MNPSPLKKVDIAGSSITPATLSELHAGIAEIIARNDKGFVLSGNVHSMNLAAKLPWLKDFFNRADIVRVDGAGLVLGARILGHAIPPRLTWADWGLPLAKFITDKGYSLFLLGGPHGAAQMTAEIFRQKNPSINIVGTHHGYFAKQGDENHAILEQINQATPDILVVGLGMPLQEKWILENEDRLNVKIILTCGAAFEYLSGTKQRCPKWMGDAGLEWLYRLLQEPKRMFKRYVVGNTVFILRVLRERLTP